MKSLFLCSNVTQLMAYKYLSISKSHSYIKPVSDISVYVNNEYCNDASKEIIRASSIKFGYGNYITSLNDFDLASNKSTKQKIDLITRRRPANTEISEILKNFEIVNYYTVEDGIGNYIKEDFFSHTTFDHKYREVSFRIKNILGLLLKLIKFQKADFFLLCNEFGLNNKIDLISIDTSKDYIYPLEEFFSNSLVTLISINDGQNIVLTLVLFNFLFFHCIINERILD